MNIYLFPGNLPSANPGGFSIAGNAMDFAWKRHLAVAGTAVLAFVLHALVFLWIVTRPAPAPFSEAAPLPMIDMILSAPPSPAVTRSPVTPPPKKINKPKLKRAKKPKPVAVKKESPIKRVEPEKQEAQSDAPAPPAPSNPIQGQTGPPRNDVFTPASTNANYLNNPKPVYPRAARSRHWEGLVMLRVYVTADGHAGEVSVQRSSGHEVLDESALSAVRRWRFVPARRGDLVQASWATVPIEFVLR
ncbi:MAG: energy transducer TonB [Methylococcaceae bacterium]|nr:energy transducer TonB [Methylococcaceae bacterium]MCI0733985.1 energy transducer TonB [Methylococcaceae bacterium]